MAVAQTRANATETPAGSREATRVSFQLRRQIKAVQAARLPLGVAEVKQVVQYMVKITASAHPYS